MRNKAVHDTWIGGELVTHPTSNVVLLHPKLLHGGTQFDVCFFSGGLQALFLDGEDFTQVVSDVFFWTFLTSNLILPRQELITRSSR